MAHTFTLIKNGEQVSFSREPASVLATLKNGRYTVTVSREKEPRSLDQNALMWLWFTCIERETGMPRQDIHDYYCKRFLRKVIHWNDHDEVVVEGTSRQTKERMTTFLNQVQSDAETEFGIRLPNPEDRYFEDFYETYKQR